MKTIIKNFLAIEGKRNDGWYQLGKVKVVK